MCECYKYLSDHFQVTIKFAKDNHFHQYTYLIVVDSLETIRIFTKWDESTNSP